MGERTGPMWQWVAGQPIAVVALDVYELVNLRAAIQAIGYPYPSDGDRSPLEALNSGDWIGQLYQKLPDPELLKGFTFPGNVMPYTKPNNSPPGYRDLARRYAAQPSQPEEK